MCVCVKDRERERGGGGGNRDGKNSDIVRSKENERKKSTEI